MDGSTVRPETLATGGGRWTGVDRSSSYPGHLGMEMLKMVPSSPYDGFPLERDYLLPWISAVWWKLLEICLFLLKELLSTSSVNYGLTDMMRKRSIYHQPHSQVGNTMVGMENKDMELKCNRSCLDPLQYSAGVHPDLLPHYILPADSLSMAEGKLSAGSDCQMDTLLESQSEMAFICTNPLILAMIQPDTENARSLDPGDEELPSDWPSDSEENIDDAESSDWSSDDDSCDESESHLWESFFQNDPYNPLNFSASIGQRDLTCKTDTDDEEDSSMGQFESAESDQLWDSFFQNTDPLNPLNFSACATTRASSNQGVKEGACSTELSKEGLSDTPGLCFNTDPSNGMDQPAPTSKPDSSENQKRTVKKVRFCPVVEVHRMIVWDFAYRAARKGPWEQHARDRSRFKRRIANTEAAIGFCLDQEHRRAVWTKLYGN